MARKTMDWEPWVDRVAEAIDFYHREFGVRPLIRMVFYHLTKFGLANTTYAYKYLDRLLVKARRDGRLPWGAFAEDKERQPGGGDYYYETIEEAIERGLDYLWSLPDTYHLPIWWGQDTEVLVMVEKAGERDVFVSLTRNWNVLVAPCRGYGAWESLKSVVDRVKGREVAVFYFGDFDPSGNDIPRFVEDAFSALGLVPKEFTRLGVTKEQIDRFSLPHKPEDEKEIKKLLRDPRYKKWPYGLFRVETEALLGTAPDYVRDLLDENIGRYFNSERRQEALAEEEGLRQELRSRIDELKRKLTGD